TDQSTDDTSISSYKGVWHLSNNSFADATSYNNDLANNGTVNSTGLIEEGRSFDGINDNLRSLTTTDFGRNAYNQTISAWARYTSLPNETQNLIVLQRQSTPSAVQMGFREVSGTYRVVVWNWGGAPLVYSNSIPSANTWHYYSYTFDGTTHRLFIDGIEAGSSTTPATQNSVPQYVYLGSYSGGEYYEGLIDEARYSLSQKTSGWIKTEYDNQINPGSFISVGEEQEMDFLSSAGFCNVPMVLTGYPSGGVFTGPGVTGTVFHPDIAGTGTHLITYTNNVDGCNVSISKSINVTPVPPAPVTADEFCCVRSVADLDAIGSNLKWYSAPSLATEVGWGTPFASGQTAVGTYTFYVTQTVNGCVSEASQAVLTIYPNTPVGGTSTVSRTPECIGN
ncbi:LamG domain-containing protein, partial [bacterium]|nr:LamG domain-containing protein [bacterium]